MFALLVSKCDSWRDGDASFARDFLLPCGEDTLCCKIDDWVTVRDWQPPLRRERRLFAEGCAGHGEKKVKLHWEQKSSGEDDVEDGCWRRVSGWGERLDQTSSPSLGQACWWPSSVGGVLVPTQLGPKKKQILLFAPRACGAVPALFTRTGRWPLTYYLVLASLSLSQRDLHQQGLSEGLFHLHTDCVVLLLCLTTLHRMSGVLWICFWKQQRFMENNINNFVFKAPR